MFKWIKNRRHQTEIQQYLNGVKYAEEQLKNEPTIGREFCLSKMTCIGYYGRCNKPVPYLQGIIDTIKPSKEEFNYYTPDECF